MTISRKLNKLLQVGTLLTALSSLHAAAAAMIPSPPQLAATSYILVDAVTGKVLVEQDADARVPPASLTKMMTAYVAEAELAGGNINRDDKVLVSEKAWRMGGSRMFIEVGERVSVSDLLKGIIIVSGNDASVALAEHIAGSEGSFADLMNSTASRIGMKNTHFVNSSGYPAENHYSSARDLATLSRHIIYDYPEYYTLYDEKYFQYGVNKKTGKPLNPQPNRNSLLWSNKAVDGLKTGHTSAAGYCLAASAKRDGQRLIAVVLGTKSERARASETQKLFTYGFRFFDNVEIKKGGKALEVSRVWKGTADEVGLGLTKDLVVTVPRGQEKNLKATMQIDKRISAPIAKGQTLGMIEVRLNDDVIESVPLVALDAVEEGGLFKRLLDAVKLFFIELFGG
ncbi:D-alanyl-D-alanine carboxypeptidase family protein [Endozoicomonadaceae bacterium StTr2]